MQINRTQHAAGFHRTFKENQNLHMKSYLLGIFYIVARDDAVCHTLTIFDNFFFTESDKNLIFRYAKVNLIFCLHKINMS